MDTPKKKIIYLIDDDESKLQQTIPAQLNMDLLDNIFFLKMTEFDYNKWSQLN